MPFTKRAQDALETALHDRESTYEILSKIVLLEQHVGIEGGDVELAFDQISGEVAVDQLPTTGLKINQHTSKITEYPSDPVITLDCSLSDWHSVVIMDDHQLEVINVGENQEFIVIITQGAELRQTVQWFDGIRWAYGNIPTLTKQINKSDMFKFKQISPGVYFGMIYGQGY